MIKSGKWDEVAARKQLQTISDVQAEARYHRAHYLFEVSWVLTPEQKAKLHEMLSGDEAMPVLRATLSPLSHPRIRAGCVFLLPVPLLGQAPSQATLASISRMHRSATGRQLCPQDGDSSSPSCPSMRDN